MKKKRRTGHTRTHLFSMVENTNILYVYPNLPLVMSILLKVKYLTNLYHSPIVKQLIELDMTPLAQTAACQNLPLAGQVSHFIKNWEVITQDLWVLNCVNGYTISLRSKPHQHAPPKELHFSKEDTLNLTKELQNMVDKNAISRVCKRREGFLSQLFMVPKKRWGPKAHHQPEEAQLLCTNRALQDGGH